MKHKLIISTLGLLAVASIFYTTQNTSKDTHTKQVSNKNILTDIDHKITSINDVKNDKKVISNSQTIEKIKYSKVALPDEVRDIEHELVDMQNEIDKDKYQLDLEAKELLANANYDDEIDKAEELLEELKQKTKMPQEKIEEIESSYSTIVNTPVTSQKALAIQDSLIQADNSLMDIENDIEKLQNGEL